MNFSMAKDVFITSIILFLTISPEILFMYHMMLMHLLQIWYTVYCFYPSISQLRCCRNLNVFHLIFSYQTILLY